MKICTFKNCQVGSTDAAMICCWICAKPMHAKCAGFGGIVADSINDSSTGVFWSCEDCRGPVKDITRFINITKNSFFEMSKDFSSLFNKFKSQEENFKKLKISESEILSSPKRKKTNTRALRSNSALVENSSTSSNPPLPNNSQNNAGNVEVSATIAPEPARIDPGTPSGVINNSNTNETGPLPLVKMGTSEPILKSVPKKKSLFVSRLDPTTSEQDVANFINAKLKNKATIFVKKFHFNYERDVASFKITPPAIDFPKILDKNFWPPDILTHEFIERPKARVKTTLLPTPATPSSKN